jgi:hypothetical protein
MHSRFTTFSSLSEKDIWDIVNFVRKLQGFDVMEHWKKQQEGGNMGQ